jgi:hypothetical protein
MYGFGYFVLGIVALAVFAIIIALVLVFKD